MYNEPYLNIAGAINGIYNDKNMDTEELSTPYIDSRRKEAEILSKTIDGEVVTYYRYELCICLNIGLGKFYDLIISYSTFYLAKQPIPLPRGVPIQICLNRAHANKALIKKEESSKPLSDDTIKILSPTLACYFVESVKAESFYSKTKLYDVSIDFLDYNIRRELLSEGVADHKLKLFEGPLPSGIVIGFMDPEAFDGDYAKSSVKFEKHNIDTVDLQVDNLSLVDFPLSMKSNNYIEFYLNYLKSTNRFQNAYASGAISFNNFSSNFLIFKDLKEDNLSSGQLILKLKFKEVLSKKLYVIFMPMFEKSVSFDSHLNISVK